METPSQSEDAIAQIPEVIDSEDIPTAKPSEREQSTTVGTGSYVAVSCSAVMLLLTFVILGILFLTRWL